LFKAQPNFEAEYFSDTHHPNARGNRVIAEALAQFFAEFMAEDFR
jgi:lysophospholipase L1-like esterase